MHIEERTLDVSKKDGRSGKIKPVILRKGEQNQTQIKINLTSDGEPYSIGNLTPKFCAVLPNKKYVRDTSHVTKSTNYVTYTVQSDLTSADGDIRVAYIELQSSGNSLTSDTLPIIVLENTDLTTEQAQQYQDQIEALVKDLENSINKANNAASSATTAASSANTAASNANTARTNAQNAANSANTAATAANNAASAANTAKTNADAATKSANDAATKATTAASNAKQTVDDAMETFRTISGSKVAYQVGTSGTTPPTGTWVSNPPSVPQGQYLWARTTTSYNKGSDTVVYAVAFQGRDGSFAGDERVEALEEAVESINDYTTGINQLRGTRDFYLTTNIHPDINAATFPLDGFIIGGAAGYIWEFAKDNEGYTVASVSQSGLNAQKVAYINASLVPVKYGDVLTISADFMVDNLSDLTSQDVLPAYLFASGNPNPLKTINSGTLQSKAKEPVESGKWIQLSYTIEVDMEDARWFMVRGMLLQNGSIHFRKFDVQYGAINNSIYSVNPADMALEPVNDITTGINLLRSTRDFLAGTKKVGTGNGNVYYDGFSFAGTWNRSVDEQGYTVVTNGQTSVPQIYGFVIDDFTVTDQYYTFSVEMKVSDVSKMGTGIIFALSLIDKNGASISGTTSNLTIKPADKTELADGKWHRIIFHAIPKSNPDAFGLRVSLVSHEASEANVISYKKPLVYKGVIENPEWSASPFDVASSYEWNRQVPMPLGYPSETNFLTGDENLDEIITAGVYVLDGNTLTENITGLPADYGTKGSFRLTVSYVRPRKSADLNNFVKQVLESYQYKYERTSSGEATPGNTKWRDWVFQSDNIGLMPIAGGGTGAKTNRGASNNLFGNMREITTTPLDNSKVVFFDDNHNETNGAMYSEKLTNVWQWIASKIEATYNVSKKASLPAGEEPGIETYPSTDGLEIETNPIETPNLSPGDIPIETD